MTNTFKIEAPLIIAHRGASTDAPENTAIAIELAAQQGAKWVEVDLHLTADQRIVVIHDETINRTTDGKGLVSTMTLTELQKLDAGSWFGNEYAGQRLLTLEQLITLLEHWQLNVNLEIKADENREVETSEITAQILQKYWPTNKALPLISSFSSLALTTIQRVAQHLPRGMLLEKWDPKQIGLVQELECVTVNLSQRYVNTADVSSIKELNKKVMIYTVDKPTRARELFDMGVDGIFTNRPGYMIATLGK